MNERFAHILIVDDEPGTRLMFRTALEAAGYSVDEAGDGELALLWLLGSEPDLILLDLEMPQIQGFDVLECIQHSGRDVPTIVVSAHGTIRKAVDAMRLGAIDFLVKPVRPDVLRSLVNEALGRRERSLSRDDGMSF